MAERKGTRRNAKEEANVELSIDVEKIVEIENPKNATLGFASVKIANAITVNSIAIVNGENGLFISMPSRKYTDEKGKDKYTSTVFVNDKRLFERIEDAVLDKWEE